MSDASHSRRRASYANPRLRRQPVLRRSHDEVQIGVDSTDSVRLAGVTSDVDWLFGMLDGCHHRRTIERAAAAHQTSPAIVEQLLALLAGAGLLADGGR